MTKKSVNPFYTDIGFVFLSEDGDVFLGGEECNLRGQHQLLPHQPVSCGGAADGVQQYEVFPPNDEPVSKLASLIEWFTHSTTVILQGAAMHLNERRDVSCWLTPSLPPSLSYSSPSVPLLHRQGWSLPVSGH